MGDVALGREHLGRENVAARGVFVANQGFVGNHFLQRGGCYVGVNSEKVAGGFEQSVLRQTGVTVAQVVRQNISQSGANAQAVVGSLALFDCDAVRLLKAYSKIAVGQAVGIVLDFLHSARAENLVDFHHARGLNIVLAEVEHKLADSGIFLEL